MKIIVDNIATLYYDAPSNTSRGGGGGGWGWGGDKKLL